MIHSKAHDLVNGCAHLHALDKDVSKYLLPSDISKKCVYCGETDTQLSICLSVS